MFIANSIGELIEHVSVRIHNDRRVLWFRGHTSTDWDILPAIWRGYDNHDERNFTNRFRSRARTRHSTTPEYSDLGAWLSLMQHYGLPTRLLDWTRSPLVALYFALEPYIYSRDNQSQDACIWMLEPHKLNVYEGFQDVTPSIVGGMSRSTIRPAFFDRRGDEGELQVEENDKVLAVMADESDPRMFVQQGCFTIHSSRSSLEIHANSDEILKKIEIPSSSVKQMAWQLDACGFRKGDLFPDLQNLAEEMKGIFPPEPSKEN